ncbi:hemerythrin domain-containing protein [Vibrio ulleungensis]|uniref:Hemerythrin domain-containing protein n=1 Tax=Vibrio ulleungensis TaxID=2807619 RepID=A0ABS2HKF9_9VIBR|nr:hemerythrin domain-containing protein [Vibrio ulleungensis]MBM7037539.1 hemerythrin domain-containing protein [Vibrio ulleungensis]
MMIEAIRREHGYMVRLLAILKKKLTALKAEETINYSLVYEIADYLCNHTEKTHHPKEDLIYRYYLDHYGMDKTITNLEDDHVQLSEKSHAFLTTVEMILQDAIVPTDIFSQQLGDFIRDQKTHLDIEEREILPRITDTFTVSDWQALEAQWGTQEDDPVFGETIADKYKQLAERVKGTEREYV